MLNELSDLQESDETLWSSAVSFEFETRSADGNELVHKKYKFSYATEWDKWTFQEYHEERTRDTPQMSERNWSRSRHIIWSERETPTIDVPPEVADALAEATGADSVTIQIPRGSINDTRYETVREATAGETDCALSDDD